MSVGVALVRYEAIPDTVWASLHAAASDRSHPMRLCTVATINGDGLPDARLLVLRGALREQSQLWFHTDCRAPKIAQLASRPGICIVTYDPRAGIQLRVYGHAVIHTNDAVAARHWEQTELAVRYAYGATSPPGTPIPVRDPRMASRRRKRTTQELEEGRQHFAVIDVAVTSVDWLQVSESGDRRAVLRADEDWTVTALSP